MSVSMFLVINWIMTIAVFAALGSDLRRRRLVQRAR